MVVGLTLMKLSGGSYFSPQFPRGGLGAVFAIELLMLSTGATLSVSVQHKNEEDITWTVAGSFAPLAGAGIGTLDLTGLKENLRFVYIVGGTNQWDAAHFNVLAPAWRPY